MAPAGRSPDAQSCRERFESERWLEPDGLAVQSDADTEVGRGNEAIDAAAVSVGRDPHDIRRIWDFESSFGTPRRGIDAASADRWTDQLLPLALVHGMSTFILISNHAATIQRFGNEVAPALREAVEHERRATDCAR